MRAMLAGMLIVAACGCARRTGNGTPESSHEAMRALREASASFTYAGRPIHPKLVQEFEGWLSDGGPITLAVDVRAADGTDEYRSEDVRVAGDGAVYTSSDGQRGEWYRYERIGAFADGTQVLKTAYNGGGSGVFMSVVLVRFSCEPLIADDGSQDYRLVMRVVRDVSLGDRDGANVAIVGDRLVIGPSQYRASEMVLNAP